MKKLRPSTAYLLKSLIPYTSANQKLAFKPSSFFKELERLDRLHQPNSPKRAGYYKQQYYRTKNRGYFSINDDGLPELTELGKTQLTLYEPEKIPNALLLVAFDVEEKRRANRDEFRRLLKMLKFKQVQKSVWVSRYESRELLKSETKRLNLDESVVIYEALDITPISI